MFEDRVALVTGAGQGIGRASARAFASRGARVVVADINEESGAETVALIAGDGGEAIFVPVDVTREEQVAAMVQRTMSDFGRLDFAHNNAAIDQPVTATDELDRNVWDRVLETSLTSVFLCMKHEIPHMLAGGGGAIVNASSGVGLIGHPRIASYVAAKHGVVGLTKSTALEYADRGVRVNAVCPGCIDTPMLQGMIGGDEQVRSYMTGLQPMGRIGAPEEVASVVVWLCSQDASFMTGTAIPVDGGGLAD